MKSPQEQQPTQKQIRDKKFNYLVENYKEICYNIKDSKSKYRDSDDNVRIMAVTKTVEPDLINFAIEQGIDLLGENRVQEFLSKKEFYKPCEVQFIGHLQTNKVKYIIGDVSQIQSVDSFKLAKEIDRLAKKIDKTMDILIEVNIGDELSKSGISRSEVLELAKRISELENVRINGLMAIPPINADDSIYGALQELYIDIGQKKLNRINMNVLSVGMSGDYIKAVKYGSNLVRIGTKLFGARKYLEVSK